MNPLHTVPMMVLDDELTDAEYRMIHTLIFIEKAREIDNSYESTAYYIAELRNMSYTGVLRILNSLETKEYVHKEKLPGTKEKTWILG